jgi:hypothetical protein
MFNRFVFELANDDGSKILRLGGQTHSEKEEVRRIGHEHSETPNRERILD